METLAIPPRVGRTGQLDRGPGTDAIVSLLGTMVATYSTLWPHAPWFGLAEHVLDMNMSLSEQSGLKDALNTALSELGIDWVEVRSVTASRQTSHSGELQLDLALVLAGGEVVFQKLPL